MPVTLLTCVTNAGGVGPGHSAIVIEDTVYSFEAADYGGNASGWLVISKTKYLANNEHRPVFLQELTSEVDPGKALQYIVQSISNDDDYGGSGVCSSQAASAIDAAYAGDFNTWGVDKPYEIYQLAKELGIVAKEEMVWPGKDSLSGPVRNSCNWVLDKLSKGYSWLLM